MSVSSPLGLGFVFTERYREFRKPGVFLGTEHLSGPTSWAEFPARRSAVKLAVIVIPSQEDAGEDVDADEHIILLLIDLSKATWDIE